MDRLMPPAVGQAYPAGTRGLGDQLAATVFAPGFQTGSPR
jgi:hypothetical protein